MGVREKKPSICLSNFCTPITGCSRQPPTSITNGPCLSLYYPVRQFSLLLWANLCDRSPQSVLSTLVLGQQNSVSLPFSVLSALLVDLSILGLFPISFSLSSCDRWAFSVSLPTQFSLVLKWWVSISSLTFESNSNGESKEKKQKWVLIVLCNGRRRGKQNKFE
jgi:hypothetical protein